MKIIDGFVKPPFAEALDLGIYKNGGAMFSRFKRNQLPDPGLTTQSVDLVLKQQRGMGVVANILHAQARGPGFDPHAEPEELSNAAVKNFCDQHKEFFGLASVDPVSDPDAVDTLASCLDNGFIGAVLYPGWMPEPTRCDDPRLFPAYEECIARDMPVVLLNGGFAGPDLSYGEPVHVDRLSATFPKLKIVLSHAAYPNVQEITGLLYRRQNIWLMPDMYFPSMPGEQDFVLAMTSFARERMLYSSAYPLAYGRDQLERIQRLDLPPTVLERYLCANAAEVFGLSV